MDAHKLELASLIKERKQSIDEIIKELREDIENLTVSDRIGQTLMRCNDCGEDFAPRAWRWDGNDHCPACTSIDYTGHDEIKSLLEEELEFHLRRLAPQW